MCKPVFFILLFTACFALLITGCAPPLQRVRTTAKTVSKAEALSIADNSRAHATEVLAAMVSGRPLRCDPVMIGQLLTKGANAFKKFDSPALTCPSGAKVNTPFAAAAICCEGPAALKVFLDQNIKPKDEDEWEAIATALLEEVGQAGVQDPQKVPFAQRLKLAPPIVETLALLLSDPQSIFTGSVSGLRWLTFRSAQRPIPFVATIMHKMKHQYGVDLDHRSKSGTQLGYAMEPGIHETKLRTAIALVEAGASLKSMVDAENKTHNPLQRAAWTSGPQAQRLALLMIDKGANIRAVGRSGGRGRRSLLRWALKRSHWQLALTAIRKGDDLGVNRRGRTAMHDIFEHEMKPHQDCGIKLRLVQEMIARGANPNAVARSSGDTPMHLALKYWGCSWVQSAITTLMLRGAKSNIPNIAGKTALDYGKTKRCHPTARAKILERLQNGGRPRATRRPGGPDGGARPQPRPPAPEVMPDAPPSERPSR